MTVKGRVSLVLLSLLFAAASGFAQESDGHLHHPNGVSVNVFSPMFGVAELGYRRFVSNSLELSIKGYLAFGIDTVPWRHKGLTPFGYTVGYYGLASQAGVNLFIVQGFYLGLYAAASYSPPFSNEEYYDGVLHRLVGIEMVTLGALPLIGYRWDFRPFFAVAEFGFGYGIDFPPGQLESAQWGWVVSELNLAIGVSF